MSLAMLFSAFGDMAGAAGNFMLQLGFFAAHTRFHDNILHRQIIAWKYLREEANSHISRPQSRWPWR